MSSERAGLFVATMTGTADICAQEIETVLSKAGFSVDRLLMDGLDASALNGYDFVVIISSTYGHGDIPDNGQSFYESVQSAEGLAGTRFAVFGLGDSTYAATFCDAGKKWDRLLAEKGASRICPLMEHDASSGTLAEDVAGVWMSEWINNFAKVA